MTKESEEQLVARILAIEREQKRRKDGDKLSLYNKAKKHKKQIAFHKCKKRNRWVFGGNRSGKTECGAVEAVYMARGIHPYRKNKPDVFGWVVSLSQQVQRDVAQRKILSYLSKDWIEDIIMLSGRKDNPQSGVIDQIKVRNVFGGISTIGFKSCDQGREKFQGSSLDFVWFDEEPPQDVYYECQMRVLDKCGDIFGTMTPLKGLTFIYEEVYLNKRNNPEIWYEFMEWADNPYLDKKEIALLEKALPSDQLESRRFGRFSHAQGLVYTEFDPEFHVVKPFPVPREWQDTISIDPGLNNPLSAHWYCTDFDGNVYVVYEHFAAGRDIDYHATEIKRISDMLGWHRDFNGKISALIDSAASQRTLASNKSVAELFIERGINVNTKVNKDMFAGISQVKSYLNPNNGKPNIYIFEGCVNLIYELKSYFWGSGDLPVKKDDHALDEMRYYLMSKPSASVCEEKKGPIALDKERKINSLRTRERRKRSL